MKIFKNRFIIEIILSIIIIFIYMYEINNRNFLCFSNGKCVTTWENLGNLIIIPNKYFGLVLPSEYVEVDIFDSLRIANISLSKSNEECFFKVNSMHFKNYAKNKICTISTEVENNLENEIFMIYTCTEFVGGGTIINKMKDGKKEIIVEAYRIFQNGYIPFLIIIFIVFFIRWIYIKPVINNKSLKEKIKTILLFIIGNIFESIVVILINILLVISIIALIMWILNG